MSSWSMTASNVLRGAWESAFVVVAGITAACGNNERGSLNRFLLCDLSSSGAGLSCRGEVIQAAAAGWLEDASGIGAGRFEVHIVGRGIADVQQLLALVYPRRFPAPVSEGKRHWADSVRAVVDSLTRDLPADRGSALMEAIYRVTHRTETVPGARNELVIASDLRQVTSGTWNFERSIPDEARFLEWVRSSGLEPQPGVFTTITACGVHLQTPAGSAAITAVAYNQLEAMWGRLLARWANETQVLESCADLSRAR